MRQRWHPGTGHAETAAEADMATKVEMAPEAAIEAEMAPYRGNS